MNYIYILDFLLLAVAYTGVAVTAQTGIYCVMAMQSLLTAIGTIFLYISYCIKHNKTKYMYWFKQQSSALTFLTIWSAFCYMIGCKWMGEEAKVIVLTPDYVVVLISQALCFIFITPFFFKWWDPTNEGSSKDYSSNWDINEDS